MCHKCPVEPCHRIKEKCPVEKKLKDKYDNRKFKRKILIRVVGG